LIPQVIQSGLRENGIRVKQNDLQVESQDENSFGICIPTPEAFRDPVQNVTKSEEDAREENVEKSLTSPNDKSSSSCQTEEDQENEDECVSEAAKLHINGRYSPATSSSPSPPMFCATVTTSASPTTSMATGYPFSLQSNNSILTPHHQSNSLLHEIRERRTRSTNASCESSCGNNIDETLVVKYPSLRSLVTPPPTPSSNNGTSLTTSNGVNSSMNGNTLPLSLNGLNHMRRLSKNGELRGSAASLLSGSSNFSSVSFRCNKI
jgi:hypothetical protein